MKRSKKFMSLALAIVMILSVSASAYINHKVGTKATPYGTLTGEIFMNGGVDEWSWYCATTSIDSNYTMALSYVKMDAIDNATGDLIRSSSEVEPNANEAFCIVDVSAYEDVTLYTTHEITYTTSYVLYMYKYIG